MKEKSKKKLKMLYILKFSFALVVKIYFFILGIPLRPTKKSKCEWVTFGLIYKNVFFFFSLMFFLINIHQIIFIGAEFEASFSSFVRVIPPPQDLGRQRAFVSSGHKPRITRQSRANNIYLVFDIISHKTRYTTRCLIS